MSYSTNGVRFVLTAPETESTEQGFSPWKQMVYASVPARFARRWMYADRLRTESRENGSAVTMPCGLRIVEQVLLENYPAEDVVVCHPEMLDRFVGPDTKVVAIAAHNPIGVAFSTGVYSNIFGSTAEPINAFESLRVFRHPAIQRQRPRVKVIVGGAGAWQIEKMQAYDRLGVDCVVNGRAETVILDLLQKAERGEPLPRVIIPPEPRFDQIRVPKRRTTFGVVEITRGCGRQCSFCSPTLETRVSVPKEEVMDGVRANVREGGRCIFPVSEDLFIYGAKQPFYVPNADAIMDLYESIASVPGVDYVPLSHCTIAPALVNPELIKEMSRVLLDKSILKNPASTHPDKHFLSPLIGIETGSTRLAAQIMSGKSLPYDVRDWQEIVVQGIEILNRNNWFPVCTFIVGLPGETDDDVRESLQLLERLKKFKILYVPSIFTPLEDTRLAQGKTLKLREMTQLQWEFILTAWRRSLDFAVVRKQSNLAWKLGMMGFYYLRGKWIHGPQFKYPAFRFAGISEERISKHLYIRNGNGASPEIPTRSPRLIAKHQEHPQELFQIQH